GIPGIDGCIVKEPFQVLLSPKGIAETSYFAAEKSAQVHDYKEDQKRRKKPRARETDNVYSEAHGQPCNGDGQNGVAVIRAKNGPKPEDHKNAENKSAGGPDSEINHCVDLLSKKQDTQKRKRQVRRRPRIQ